MVQGSETFYREEPSRPFNSPSAPPMPPTPPTQDEARKLLSPPPSDYDSDYSSHECTSECEEYSDADTEFELAEEAPDSV